MLHKTNKNSGGNVMETRYITLSDGVGMGDVLIVIKTNAPKEHYVIE